MRPTHQPIYLLKSIHDERKTYKCDLCDSKFKSKCFLKYHTESVHIGIKPFQCENCGKELSSKQSLKNHMKVVHQIENK